MQSSNRSAFTLVETLVVCAIVALLSALLLPVINQARSAGRRAVSTSNLRQCGMALQLYCDDHGGWSALPTHGVAVQVLKTAPTDDPSDTWRRNPEQEFGSPLIGSYAYIRGVGGFETPQDWAEIVATRLSPRRPILASIYYASVVPDAFPGTVPDLDNCVGDQNNCLMPDRVLRLDLDGAVRLTRVLHGYSGGNRENQFFMSWQNIFMDFAPDAPGVSFPAPK